MKWKLFGMLVLCGATAAACKVTVVDDATGGGGSGSTTTTSKASATSSKASGVTSTGATATGACDDIGTCQGDGMTPTTGCLECSINGDATVATDGGSCQADFISAYGTMGDCSDGGVQGACDFLACGNACDTNGNGLDTPAELDCFCSNDGSKCLPQAQQTDTMTCVGALVADTAAFNAEATFETCVYMDVCPVSCM